MRGDVPSLTACVVAWARASASLAGGSVLDPGDALTLYLLPTPFSLSIEAMVRASAISSRIPRAVFAASLGLFDHVVLRTAAIDEALKQAVAGGIDQRVILGAGLDARAHRMPELSHTTVFEVDHPSSQRFKRRKAARVLVQAREVRYVAVDFERDALVDRLRASDFDPGKRSFWIWEGVIPYLHLSAIEGTLRAVHALAAPGSELVATYVTNQSAWVRRRRAITQSALRLIGEPLRTQLSPRDAARLASDAGFQVVSDTHTADWHKRYADHPETKPVPSLEHILWLRR